MSDTVLVWTLVGGIVFAIVASLFALRERKKNL